MLASPPTLSPDHAYVVEAHVAYDEPPTSPIAREPVTTARIRDARGMERVVRVVGGANRSGGTTYVAGHVVPVAGAIVRSDLVAESARIDAWTRGDPPATWPLSSLPVAFALGTPTPRDLGGAALAELDVALRTWPLVACTAWRTELAGATSAPAGDDGVNAIYWNDGVWPAALVAGALAQTILHTDATGALRDADIHVNGADYRWSTSGDAGALDARGVLVHELGHALGLGHSTDARATMFVTHAPGIAWRSLEGDDRDGVCALYPGVGAVANASDCETGAACPSGFACVAKYCERLGALGEVCSPCARVPGACDGAGDDARCIDVAGDDAASTGRVCGRACARDVDCGARFRCRPTTSSGDLQCVSNDACASGPAPCAVDADCNGQRCVRRACVGALSGTADAGREAAPSNDAGDDARLTSSGGCSVAPGRARERSDPLAALCWILAVGFSLRRIGNRRRLRR